MTSPEAMRRERKVVSALFADLVGSTALTETLDPEDAMEVVGAAVAAMVLVVEELGGTVKDLAGDGVLALFGAPVAHEDDEERAIRAGLRIVEAVRAADGRLDVRVGIDTGLVVLGPVGAGSRVEYGATGDTVNVAARLQAAAEPGTVLVGETTRRAVEERFAWGPRRELALKGKAEPVPASAVAGTVNAVPPLRTYDRPLVGRRDELAALHAAVDDALEGRAGFVVVQGDGGVGKSRLLDEARAHGDRRRGWYHWVTLRCLSYERTVPFGPLRRLLEGWLGIDRRSSREDATAAARAGFANLFGGDDEDVDTAVGLVFGLPGAASTASDAAAYRVAETVDLILRRLLASAPVVVAVEDVQWADRSTLDLLDHLVDRLDEQGILLVIAGRPVAGHPLERWADLAASGLRDGGRVVSVGPLSPAEAETHLESLVGGSTLPIDLERTVLATAEGNPYFLEELVRALIDAGAVVDTAHGPAHVPAVPFDVPKTLERVVLERIDRLPDEPRRLASAAAVAGRTFATSLLAAVLDADEGAVRTWLKELTRLGLTEVADDGWRFTHTVVQDAVYHALLRRDRRDLHRRVASALEAADADPAARAHHWAEAGEPARALAPALAAASAACAAAAYDEAVTQFEVAVAAAEAGTGAEVGAPAGLLLRLADAERRAGRLDAALATFERAAAVAATAPPGPDGDALALAAVGFEDTFFATRRPRSSTDPTVGLLRTAATALGDEVTGRRVRVLAALGRALAYGGHHDEGRAAAGKAVALARAAGDAGAAAYALLAWRTDALGPDRLADRLPLAVEAVEAAGRAGDDDLWIEAARALFVDRLTAGQRDEADALLAQLRTRIAARREPFHLWYLAMWEVQEALLDGDLDLADRRVEDFRRQGRRLRSGDVGHVYAFQKLLVAREAGEAGDLVPLFRRLDSRDGPASGRMPAMLAVLLAEVGDAAAPDALGAVAADGFAGVPDDQARPALLALLAEAVARVGTVDDAAALEAGLAPWSGQALVVGAGAACLGAADHYLGVLARARGDEATAAARLQAAAELHDRLRAPLLAARTKAVLAAVGRTS